MALCDAVRAVDAANAACKPCEMLVSSAVILETFFVAGGTDEI